MGFRLGKGSFVGMGLVSPTYTTDGTSADMDFFLPVAGGFDNLQLERDVLEFDDLTSDWPDATKIQAGQRRITGSLTLRASYAALPDILRMLLGHNAGVTGTTAPFTYALTPLSKTDTSHYWLGSTLRTWCIELYRGGSVANSVFYQGCQITEFRLNFTPNAFVELVLTFIGRGFTKTAKSGAPSFAADFAYTPTGQAAATIGFLELDDVEQKVKGTASIVISSGIDFNFDITGIETFLPVPTSKDTVMVEAEVEVTDDALLDVLDDPVGSRYLKVALELDNTENTSGMRIEIDQAILEAPAESRPQNHGIQLARMSLKGYAQNDTVPAIASFTITNQESDYLGGA